MTDLGTIESPWDTFQRIADARQPSRASSNADYLDECRGDVERYVDFLKAFRRKLQDSGADADLMHEFDGGPMAVTEDFLETIGNAVKRLDAHHE